MQMVWKEWISKMQSKRKTSATQDLLLCLSVNIVAGLLPLEASRFQNLINLPSGNVVLLIDVIRMAWFYFFCFVWALFAAQNGYRKNVKFLIGMTLLWAVPVGFAYLLKERIEYWAIVIREVCEVIGLAPMLAYDSYFSKTVGIPLGIYSAVFLGFMLLIFFTGFAIRKASAKIVPPKRKKQVGA